MSARSAPIFGDRLERFVRAQAPVYDRAHAELEAGRKETHWMWFVFPQLRGLGRSTMAQEFGIASIEDARAYLAHPLLGARLRDCTSVVAALDAPSLHAVFGSPDDVKFASSMTLFALADGGEHSIFRSALERWCGGRLDAETLRLLHR